MSCSGPLPDGVRTFHFEHDMTQLTDLPITVAGASGRMGHMLIEAIMASDDCHLAGALDIAASPARGLDAAAPLGKSSGVLVTSDLHAGLKNAACLIDFTRPEGTLAHLKVCRELGVKAVIGTTGFTDEQKAEIAEIAKDIEAKIRAKLGVKAGLAITDAVDDTEIESADA